MDSSVADADLVRLHVEYASGGRPAVLHEIFAQALVLASVDHVLKEFLDDGIGFIGRPLSDKCTVGLTRRDSLSLVKAFFSL
jgi:hypothetical protein